MATAVICEFNPFHNGHKYLLEQISSRVGSEIIAVMSGSFTQRGEAAVCDKFTRARIAVENGADLVLELPTVYATAGARRFARGGVRIARAFDCVEHLAFGCEDDDISRLNAAADSENDPAVRARIADLMRGGDYYPRAAQRAVGEVMGEDIAGILSGANNILALEYIRALKNSGISPLPIKRAGARHDSPEADGGFASASLIRSRLLNGQNADAFMPEAPSELCRPELLERAILASLRRMSLDQLSALPEIGEGLEHRLFRAIREGESVEAVLSLAKTKRYTRARLRRLLVCAFLGITEELQSGEAVYARVLCMNQRGAALLKSCRAEVVTSFAKGMKNEALRPFLGKDALASDLLALGFDNPKPCASDYLTKIAPLICAG